MSSTVVEFFVKCPAFRLLSCQPVLKGGEIDGFFLRHLKEPCGLCSWCPELGYKSGASASPMRGTPMGKGFKV